MSAALVESVREAERLENVPGAWHEADVARNALDLAAILAALTEAEANATALNEIDRKYRGPGSPSALPLHLTVPMLVREMATSIAAGQAREVALREGLAFIATNECECEDHTPFACPSCSAKGALSAPTDTAALRAMLEKVWMLGYDAPDATDGNAETQRTTDIDRVLGGS